MWMAFMLLFASQTINAASKNITVHSYAPFTIPDTGPGGEAYPSHVRNDVASTHFNVKVADIKVAAVRYDNTGFGNQGHNMDVARFASNSRTPKIEIKVVGDKEVNSVTVHPVRFYPQEKLEISPDKKTVIFEMAKELPYAIVIINGDDPQDASTSNPQLTLINDPLENLKDCPTPTAPNVLNFKTFAESYLKKNPIADVAGQTCRPAGSVTDASLNDGKMFTWNYDEGVFVPYTNRIVAFPNMRERNRNDVSDALQAALNTIKNTQTSADGKNGTVVLIPHRLYIEIVRAAAYGKRSVVCYSRAEHAVREAKGVAIAVRDRDAALLLFYDYYIVVFWRFKVALVRAEGNGKRVSVFALARADVVGHTYRQFVVRKIIGKEKFVTVKGLHLS